MVQRQSEESFDDENIFLYREHHLLLYEVNNNTYIKDTMLTSIIEFLDFPQNFYEEIFDVFIQTNVKLRNIPL